MKISDTVKELLQNDKELCKSAINILLKIANKIISYPKESKYRSINLNSEVVEKTLFPAIGALEILFLMGFEEGVDKLTLPENAPMDAVMTYRDQLEQLKSENMPEVPPDHEDDEPQKKNKQPLVVTKHLLFEEEKMKRELEHQFQHVLLFESPRLQEEARNAMPFQLLQKRAKEREANMMIESAEKDSPGFDLKDCILVELLAWFKEDFFTWFDQGYCETCSKTMKLKGYFEPNEEEKEFGSSRVERYECEDCKAEVRFPRYFHPGKLLQTRKGRCMEWASCFTLMCRTFDLDARYILDKTDHVWTEVFSVSQNRWIHADCCENKFDAPLMYEKGWSKKLSYIFAFSKDEIVDVVWRYSADHNEVCSRRKRCREDWLAVTISALNKERQNSFTDMKKKFLEYRLVKEVIEFFSEPKLSKEGEYEGRLSGSLSWRQSRGETLASSEGPFQPFTFIPSEEEAQNKEIVIKYSPSQDCYIRESSNQKISGWKSGVFSSKNILRKHEKDWKMVYMARSEGSAEGEIIWKFDWSSKLLKIKSVLVVMQHKTYENGVVLWQICNGDSCFPGNQHGVLELSNKELEDCSHLEISAILSGGKGDVAWQHAQLFRQKEVDKEFPLFIKIKFD